MLLTHCKANPVKGKPLRQAAWWEDGGGCSHQTHGASLKASHSSGTSKQPGVEAARGTATPNIVYSCKMTAACLVASPDQVLDLIVQRHSISLPCSPQLVPET